MDVFGPKSKFGFGLTVTLAESVPMQPLLSVTVTKKVVVSVGYEIGLLMVSIYSLLSPKLFKIGFHKYSDPPVAKRDIESPMQIC